MLGIYSYIHPSILVRFNGIDFFLVSILALMHLIIYATTQFPISVLAHGSLRK